MTWVTTRRWGSWIVRALLVGTMAACSDAPTSTTPSSPLSKSASSASTRAVASSTGAPSSGSSATTIQGPASSTTSPRPVRTAAPARFATTTVYAGAAHPDDLAFDPAGRLLFSDYTNGTISRLETNGSVTILHRGLRGPEGLVSLPDGTLIVASERTNEISMFRPGATMPVLLRRMPGSPVVATCRQGVDGIVLDKTSGTLIVPDAPTGDLYRLSLDGAQMTRIAGGFVHPVGATVDASGNIYVADECGGWVWRVTPRGVKQRVASIGMPDDVELDGFGNLVVTDVRLVHHRVVRVALDAAGSAAGSGLTTLAQRGLIEPQGLAIAADGSIYIADDKAK